LAIFSVIDSKNPGKDLDWFKMSVPEKYRKIEVQHVAGISSLKSHGIQKVKIRRSIAHYQLLAIVR
jgi:hypothetical protein